LVSCRAWRNRGIRRILYVTTDYYFDDTSGAAVAGRSMAEMLARRGFAVEAITGAYLAGSRHAIIRESLSSRGLAFEEFGGDRCTVDVTGVRSLDPPPLRLTCKGVRATRVHEDQALR
jgi:hypothetical protein